MEPGVLGEFGVERSPEPPPLAHRDDVPVPLGEGDDFRPHPGDDGGADEDAGDRAEIRERDLALEGVDLRPPGVPAHFDVEESQRRLIGPPLDRSGEEDHAHASAPERHPGFGTHPDRLAEAVPLEEEADGRALAAGEDEAVDEGEVLDGADLTPSLAEPREGGEMPREVALNRENARH